MRPLGSSPLGSDHRLVPVSTISASRLPHREHISRSRQLRTDVSVPYRAAISAGSGSTWCLQALHHTMMRTWFAAALPSVIGGPGSVLIGDGVPPAAARIALAAATVRAPAAARSYPGSPEACGPPAIAGSGHRQSRGATASRARRFLRRINRAASTARRRVNAFRRVGAVRAGNFFDNFLIAASDGSLSL